MDEFALPELEPVPERIKRTRRPKAHWSTKRTTWMKQPSAFGKLTRKEVVSIISAMTGFTNAETSYYFDAFCALIYFELAHGRDFYITHAGTIHTILKKQRVYTDRFTGESKVTPLGARISFIQTKHLKKEIKNLPEDLKQALIARRKKDKIKPPEPVEEDEDFI